MRAIKPCLLLFLSTFIVFPTVSFGKSGPAKVQTQCVEPNLEKLELCAVRFKEGGGEVVAAKALMTAGETNTVNAAEQTAQTEQLASEISVRNADVCQSYAKQCVQSCQEAESYHKQMASTNRPDAAAHGQNAEVARRAQDELCGQIAAESFESMAQAQEMWGRSVGSMETADAARAAGTDDNTAGIPLANMDAGKMLQNAAYGAMAIGAGMCMFGSLCDQDEDSNEEQEGSSTTEEGAAIDCKAEGNHNKADCQEGLLAICMENPEATNCEGFSNLYCGFDREASAEDSAETTETAAADPGLVVEGEGVGSSFCSFQTAVNFCESESNRECPSCVQLRMSNNPVCKANPVACMPALSDSQLTAYQNQCPTDPIYASVTYIQNNAATATQPAMVSTSNVQSLAEMPTTGDEPTNYAETMESRGGVSVTFSRAPAGVGDAMGDSLFTATTDVYNERCSAGQLNNCGPRSGL